MLGSSALSAWSFRTSTAFNLYNNIKKLVMNISCSINYFNALC